MCELHKEIPLPSGLPAGGEAGLGTIPPLLRLPSLLPTCPTLWAGPARRGAGNWNGAGLSMSLVDARRPGPRSAQSRPHSDLHLEACNPHWSVSIQSAPSALLLMSYPWESVVRLSVCLPGHCPVLPEPLAEPSCLFPYPGHPQEELPLQLWLLLFPGLFLHVCQEDPGLP